MTLQSSTGKPGATTWVTTTSKIIAAQSLPGARALVTFKRPNGEVVTHNVPDDGSFIAYTGAMDSA
jgi:hypothetical protein